MVNPIKLVRLFWHMRKVKGGFTKGEPYSISEAFLRAGIIKDSDLADMTDQITRKRLADAFQDYADAIKRERGF